MVKDVLLPKEEGKKFIFFSGKGGVGKTTVSASTAIWLANQGFKTLIVSTDMQRSLNDVFDQDIKSMPTKIIGVPNLKAVTIDAGESLDRHRKKMMDTLRVLEPDSYLLKQMEIDKTVSCGSAQAAVFELSEYLNNDQYDVIVFDNAPTGAHLEKIMAQSKYVLSMASQIDKRKRLVESLGGEEEVLKQINAIEGVVKKDQRAIEILSSELTSFVMVMIPEALPLAELVRNIPILENEYHIPVRGVVINNVLGKNQQESSDFWKKRWAMQKTYIDKAYKEFPGKEFGESPVFEEEVLGINRLKQVGKAIYGGNGNV